MVKRNRPKILTPRQEMEQQYTALSQQIAELEARRVELRDKIAVQAIADELGIKS